jgi:hypothetical protein
MTPLGIPGDEFERCAEAIVAGAMKGFEGATASLRVRIVLPAGEMNRGAQAIVACLGTLEPSKIRFQQKSSLVSASQSSWTNPQQHAGSPRSPR